MKVSSRVDYGLSCVLRVADKHGKQTPVTIREVSEKEEIEPDYVEQLFIAMKRQGILRSVRGKSGGYVLSRPPSQITAKEVMEAIDKTILELVCYRKKGRRKRCSHYDNCRIRDFWQRLREEMESFLDRYTLEVLVNLRRRERNW